MSDNKLIIDNLSYLRKQYAMIDMMRKLIKRIKRKLRKLTSSLCFSLMIYLQPYKLNKTMCFQLSVKMKKKYDEKY